MMEEEEESFSGTTTTSGRQLLSSVSPPLLSRVSSELQSIETSTLQSSRLACLSPQLDSRYEIIFGSKTELSSFSLHNTEKKLLIEKKTPVITLPESSTIQSVSCGTVSSKTIVGAVDDQARIFLRQHWKEGSENNDSVLACERPKNIIESGWSGLTFSNSQALSISMFNKLLFKVDIETGKLDRVVSTSLFPTQLCVSHNFSSECFAVAEYNHLSIWDFRQSQPCIKRLLINANASQYAISWQGNTVASAGANRSVSTFDCRKWTALGSWVNCLKYEITALHLLASNNNMCFVAGLDSELSFGICDASGGSTINKIRGDGRWIGTSQIDYGSAIIGMSEHGSIYWADFTNNLTDKQAPEAKKRKLIE